VGYCRYANIRGISASSVGCIALTILTTNVLIHSSRGTLFPKSADAASKGNAAKTTLFFGARAHYSKNNEAFNEEDFTTRSNSNQELKCKAIMEYRETLLRLRSGVASKVHGPMYAFLSKIWFDAY
jgi:hypothetical protein